MTPNEYDNCAHTHTWLYMWAGDPLRICFDCYQAFSVNPAPPFVLQQVASVESEKT